MSILAFYARGDNFVPTLKDRIFRWCLYTGVLSTSFSLLSLLLIQEKSMVSVPVDFAVQILYFLSIPAMMVLFSHYIIAVLWEGDPRMRAMMLVVTLPLVIYVPLTLSTIWTGWIFRILEDGSYTEGPGIWLGYAVVYLYVFGMYAMVLVHRKKTPRSLRLILLSFPTLLLVLAFVQQMIPTVILSGAAAMAALLTIYLYLQNKRILVDELTDLQNRKAFSRILELELRRRSRFHLVVLSLDDFKEVNDRFSESVGDAILKEIAAFLGTLTPIRNLFRWNGDEFVLVLHEQDETRWNVEGLVETLRARFDRPWAVRGPNPLLSVSIATVGVPDQAATAQDVVAQLEYCVNVSKRSGKGKTVFATAETAAKLRRRNSVLSILRRTVASDAFDVHFQPIYSVAKSRFTLAEALMRLNDADLGTVSPAEFIPLAEEVGLLAEMDYQMLDKVCRYIRRLQDEGVDFDGISINFSPLKTHQGGLVEFVTETVRRNGVDPRYLIFELTERSFVDHYDQMKTLMRELNALGFRFALDDFGTGYSNLASVVGLDFQYIKLDKSLLATTPGSDRSFTLIAALSEAFSEVGSRLLIEGVETQKEFDLVDRVRGDYVQGYLCARPMPADEALRLLSDRAPYVACAVHTDEQPAKSRNVGVSSIAQRYRAIFEKAAEAIVVIQDAVIQLANPEISSLTGYTVEELLRTSILDYIVPEDHAKTAEYIRMWNEGEPTSNAYELRILARDGTIHHVDVRGTRIEWEGAPATLHLLQDVTAHKRVEEELRVIEERYLTLTETTSDCLWVLDFESFHFTYISPSILQLRGFTPEEVMAQPLKEWMTPESQRMMKELIAQKLPEFLADPSSDVGGIFELQQPHKDGSLVWVEISSKFRISPQGKVEIVGVSRNINERKKAEKDIVFLSSHDALTGVYNRYYLEEHLLGEMERSDRYGEPLSMVLFDLDLFKRVNDRFGHLVGDEVLTQISRTVSMVLRENDLLSRIGGEEFVVVMPGTDSAGAKVVAEKILRALSGSAHAVAGVVTASFGVAERLKVESFKSWFKRLDDALFLAKERGRNTVVSFEEEGRWPILSVQLEWRPEWECGDATIDAQHQKLIALSERLIHQLLKDVADPIVRGMLDELIDRAVEHFTDEESLQTRIGYPDRQRHAQAHAVLTAKALHLRTLFNQGDLTSSAFFSFVIDDFVVNHLATEDTRFFPFVKAA
jgi:diguanylate cyclase (GGDEF)-like protein/hemerythrin-like metal-binding protein/PAS domain S-box-containing protein